MKNKILSNIDNPKELEKLYRENTSGFKQGFNELYPELDDSDIAIFWHERLNFKGSEVSWGTNNDLKFVAIASIIAGFIAKLPDIFDLKTEPFYQRNIGFLIFPFLMAFFVWKNKIDLRKTITVAGILLLSLLFINSFPCDDSGDIYILSCIHLVLFLWVILGFTFVGTSWKNHEMRLDFLRYNGDLIIMSGLILIAGMILTGITIGLFSLIEIQIEEFYFRWIGVFGLVAVPIVGNYVIQTNPQLVNKVSPVIAKIFSPLVLLMLVTYLAAILYSKKDPYNDREFLLIFNILLIGVMAIIFFSVAETSRSAGNWIATVILFLLSVVTILVNSIALSAIIFRIFEWGITPNRLAVLGSNILFLLNLLFAATKLFKTLKNKCEIVEVENSISRFLPYYALWTIIVTFIFPLLFWFK